MLKEFLEYIGQQAVKAAVPIQVNPAGEPPHIYYLRNEDGALERHEAEPAPRSHRVVDVGTLTDFAAHLPKEAKPVIWYYRTGLVLIVDDTTRRDRVVMPLEFSPQLLLLQSLEKSPQWYSQAAFISMLRVKLPRCLGNHPSLIPSLRKIKYRTTAEGGSEIIQAKASVGKSLSAELSGAEPIPDELMLNVLVFNGRTEASGVQCSLDVDPEKQLFSLSPFAGDVEDAIRAAELLISQEIQEDLKISKFSCPVYYGQP